MTTSAKKSSLTKRAKECGYSKEVLKIGNRISEVRKDLSLSQNAFCDKLSEFGYVTSVSTISKYENGESIIPSDFLWVLANNFECDVTYIFTGKREKDIELRTKLTQLIQE